MSHFVFVNVLFCFVLGALIRDIDGIHKYL